jgi:hypothetical protein
MVDIIKDTINIKVVNNTNLPQNVNMLGSNADPLAVPPHLLYEWDLNTENFISVTTVSISIGTISNPAFPVMYNLPLITYNISGVVNALNTLNMGVFTSFGNIIYASNDYYIYNGITVS